MKILKPLLSLLMLGFLISNAHAVEIRGLGDKCLDVRGGSSANGTSIIMWSCHQGANQSWRFAGRAIIGLGGKCLDVQGNSSADGTPVILWSCHGGANQQWRFHSDGTVRGLGGKCLDVRQASTANGAQLIIWPCHGQGNQLWRIVNRPRVFNNTSCNINPNNFNREGCKAAIRRAYFNPATNRCEAMIWGGCADEPPFRTVQECERSCR